MPTYIFVGGTSNNVWGATANWSPAGIPTIADNVIFNAASPGCTVTTAGACLGANFTGYGNTFTFAAAGSVQVGDGGLTLGTGMGLTALGPAAALVPNSFQFLTIAEGGTTSITTNGVTVPGLQIGRNGAVRSVNNLIINGTCTVDRGFGQAYFSGSFGNINQQRYWGSPLVLVGSTVYIDGIVSGNATIILAPPPGATLTFQSFMGTGNRPSGFFNKILEINAPGGTVVFAGLILDMAAGSTLKYTAGNVDFISNHCLHLRGTAIVDAEAITWNDVSFGAQPDLDNYIVNVTSLGNINVGRYFLLIPKFTNPNINTITMAPGKRIILNGNRVQAGNTGLYAIGANANTSINTNTAGIEISITGTGNRVLTGGGTLFQGATVQINMSSGTCRIGAVPGVTSLLAGINTIWTFGAASLGLNNSTLIKTPSSVTVDGTHLTLSVGGVTGSTLSINGLTGGTLSVSGAGGLTIVQPTFFQTATVQNFGGITINAPTLFENLTSTATLAGGNTRFAGTQGWTATNYTVSANSGVGTVLKAGLTYTVNGVFTMQGISAGSRAGLFSDTRVDFTGSITGGILTLPTGTAIAPGSIVSQRSGQIPLGLAQLLPNRPVITGSFGTATYSISPPLATPVGPTAIALSAGKPAYLTFGPASTRNVLWATTQDINSQYGNPVFALDSFNDTSGQTSPSLYRTVNWGPLQAPGLPLARTFCS